MSATPVEFPRPFQIWLYSVSHAQLVLRSNRSNELETRIDILFKDVGAMHLASSLIGLSLREASQEEQSSLAAANDAEIFLDRKTYIVRASNFVGYVVAGAMFWHEDDGYYYDESFFQTSFLQRV